MSTCSSSIPKNLYLCCVFTIMSNNSIVYELGHGSDENAEISNISCNQLVLYKPSAILKPFKEETRHFNACGKQWIINQDWDREGVAGVVWEAVS